MKILKIILFILVFSSTSLMARDNIQGNLIMGGHIIGGVTDPGDDLAPDMEKDYGPGYGGGILFGYGHNRYSAPYISIDLIMRNFKFKDTTTGADVNLKPSYLDIGLGMMFIKSIFYLDLGLYYGILNFGEMSYEVNDSIDFITDEKVLGDDIGAYAGIGLAFELNENMDITTGLEYKKSITYFYDNVNTWGSFSTNMLAMKIGFLRHW